MIRKYEWNGQSNDLIDKAIVEMQNEIRQAGRNKARAQSSSSRPPNMDKNRSFSNAESDSNWRR